MATPGQLDAAQRIMRMFGILESGVVKVAGPLHQLTEARMDMVLRGMADGEFGGAIIHPITVVIKQAELIWGQAWEGKLQEVVLKTYPDYSHDTPVGLNRRQATNIAVKLDRKTEKNRDARSLNPLAGPE